MITVSENITVYGIINYIKLRLLLSSVKMTVK